MKQKIYFAVILIILLAFIYFNWPERDIKKEFVRTEDAFVVSYYSVLKDYNNIDPLFNANNINNLREKNKFDKELS